MRPLGGVSACHVSCGLQKAPTDLAHIFFNGRCLCSYRLCNSTYGADDEGERAGLWLCSELCCAPTAAHVGVFFVIGIAVLIVTIILAIYCICQRRLSYVADEADDVEADDVFAEPLPPMGRRESGLPAGTWSCGGVSSSYGNMGGSHFGRGKMKSMSKEAQSDTVQVESSPVQKKVESPTAALVGTTSDTRDMRQATASVNMAGHQTASPQSPPQGVRVEFDDPVWSPNDC
ncbi:hypothetical protein DQ04_00261070 [Trypanosoma grayi]|uniref:hypothetical protein n=1 Tax=Trypanosoma grayi TaxID=71804 RepID=UPI0004F46CB1|nr:hypothetical protein DQ04_00261070 [Trypanosoma grayi]KEG14908.1 hypothetical protein DQ04_00261070 [Trypanosoma grayi]